MQIAGRKVRGASDGRACREASVRGRDEARRAPEPLREAQADAAPAHAVQEDLVPVLGALAVIVVAMGARRAVRMQLLLVAAAAAAAACSFALTQPAPPSDLTV